MPARAPRLTALALLLSIVATPAWSQTREGGFAREGIYVGIAPQLNATLDGISFDGLTWYQEIGGTEAGILPRLDSRNTLRLVVGFRSRPLAVEFSYDRRAHGGTFVDMPVDSVFQAVNVDGRFFFLTDRRIQPHAVVGIAFPLLRIEDGSYDDPESENPVVGDARWRGTGLNTEVGVTAYVTPRLGVSVGYAYRPIWFTTERGVSNRTFELRPRFRESSANFVLMAFTTF